MQATNPHNSFFISANAGSGKTKILIDRITALILSGAKPQEILAITFTNNAAAEIRARIIKNIISIFISDDETQIKLLTELLGHKPEDFHLKNLADIKQDILIGSAKFNIQTIHSFSLELLRNYSYEAELRPGFAVMSDVDSSKIIGDIIRNTYSKPELTENFNYLASRISLEAISENLKLITDKRTNILYLLFKAGNLTNQFANLRKLLGLPEILPNITNLKRDFLMQSDLQELIRNITNIHSDRLGKTDQDKLNILKGLKFDNDLTIRQSFVKIKDFFCTKLGTLRVNFFSKKIFDLLPGVDQEIDIIAHEYLELAEYLAKIDAFEINKRLIEIAVLLLDEYRQFKQSQNLLDYEDILLKALIILSSNNNHNINYQLNLIKHILVDEAQDTSIIQWEIIDYLYNDFLAGGLSKTVFIVGDEKQSIYGFQGARHELFKQKYDELSKGLALSGAKLIKLDLVKSYRSSSGIINFVNLFCQNAAIKDSLTQFNIDLIHNAHRNSNYLFKLLPFCKKEFSRRSEKKLEFPKSPIAKESNCNKAIEQIISEITRLVTGNYYLESTKRNARYEDILILFPRRNEFFYELYQALNDQSIAVSLDGLRVVDRDIIFLDYLALIRFSYMPCDDYNLACLLKSSLFNFDDQLLEKLCSYLNDDNLSKSLYDIIVNEIYDWTAEASSVLNVIIDKSRYLSPYDFCLNLTHHFDLFNAYDDEFAGDSKIRVGQILDLIKEFGNCYGSSYHEIYQALIRHDLAIKNTGASNSIRLMSIHGSKGLEAPIVILADSNSRVSLNKDKLYFTGDNLLFTTGSSSFPEKTAAISEHNERLEAEFRRLNYVALTRAKDALIIAGNGSSVIEGSLYNVMAEELSNKTDISLIEIYDEGYKDSNLEQRTPVDNYVEIPPDLIETQSRKIVANNIAEDYHKILGIIIHNILDDLQIIKVEDRKDFINYQLDKQSDQILEEDKVIFRRVLIEIISDPQFEYLFAANNHDEVELIYKQKLLRIDKFIESEAKSKILDKIEIIDKYRTIIEEY